MHMVESHFHCCTDQSDGSRTIQGHHITTPHATQHVSGGAETPRDLGKSRAPNTAHIFRWHKIAAKGHSCTLDQAIALGSIWAIGIAIVLPHVASNHPQGDP